MLLVGLPLGIKMRKIKEKGYLLDIFEKLDKLNSDRIFLDHGVPVLGNNEIMAELVKSKKDGYQIDTVSFTDEFIKSIIFNCGEIIGEMIADFQTAGWKIMESD